MLFWLLIYIPEFVPGKQDRFKEANELIGFGQHYYPDSVLFIWLKSYLNLKQGKIQEYINLLDKAKGIGTQIGLIERHIPTRIDFERGWGSFLLLNWQSAIKYLEATLPREKGDFENVRPFTLLLLGVGNCMLGNLAEAEKWLQSISRIKNKQKTDRWIFNRALM